MMPYSDPSARPEMKSEADSPKTISMTAMKMAMAASQRPTRAATLGPRTASTTGANDRGRAAVLTMNAVLGIGARRAWGSSEA